MTRFRYEYCDFQKYLPEKVIYIYACIPVLKQFRRHHICKIQNKNAFDKYV